MTKAKNWPVRAVYIVIALALALGLLLAPGLAKVSNVSAASTPSEWQTVDTPTGQDWKIAEQSSLMGFASTAGATQLYVTGRGYDVDDLVEGNWTQIPKVGYSPAWDNSTMEGNIAPIYNQYDTPKCDNFSIPQLWSSDSYGCTWKAITKNVVKEIKDEFGAGFYLYDFNFVTVDPMNGKFVVVACILWHDIDGDGVVDYYNPYRNPSGHTELIQEVFISDDAGTKFAWPGDVYDESTGSSATYIYNMFCTTEFDSKHDIGAGGVSDPWGLVPDPYFGAQPIENVAAGPATLNPTYPNNPTQTTGVVFRLETGGLFGSWKDVSDPDTYAGWDNQNADGADIHSLAVTCVWWSPSFATDKCVMAVSHTADATYLQYGTWGTSGTTKGWNAAVGYPEAIKIVDDPGLWWAIRGAASGISLPVDFSGRKAEKRYAWVDVNLSNLANDPTYAGEDDGHAHGVIYRVVDDAVSPVIRQIPGKPLVTDVRFWGYIANGKAVAGVFYNGEYPPEPTPCCEGVQVYRNDSVEDMDICCKNWKPACKPPSGVGSAFAAFVSDNLLIGATTAPGMSYDESAFSISLDDGDNWNQVGLIDTHIDYLADMAVSPDCNKTYLLSINECFPCYDGATCDSVWLRAVKLAEDDRFSGCWMRVWEGTITASGIDPCYSVDPDCAQNPATFEDGFLRLAPEETTGETIYLVDRGTNTLWYSGAEGLDCWEQGESTVDSIADLAVKDEATIYALGTDGKVAWSDDHGFAASWVDEVTTDLTHGHTIAVLGDNVLAGGEDGDVVYSSDAGETFTSLEDVGCSGCVHVAFDSYFDENSTIYAAVASETCAGIYRWVIGTSTDWKNLGANPSYSYYGIVVGYKGGNPMSSATTGGVLYATFVYYDGSSNYYETGVARALDPAKDVCCGEQDWDYLVAGLWKCDQAQTHDWGWIDKYFDLEPSSLKVCGCLTADSNTRLFAIDNSCYGYYGRYCKCCTNSGGPDEDEYWKDCDCACYGRVWTYEDCFSKGAPTLVSPTDGTVIASDDCACENAEMFLKWERMCNACSYDIQIAKDKDFQEVVWEVTDYNPWEDAGVSDATPGIAIEPGELQCNKTYFWRVRVHDAETFIHGTSTVDDHEMIHSWWAEEDPSAVWSFSVAVGPSAALKLTSPDDGGTNLPVTGIAFTWTSISGGAKYDFVLSANSDLSSPVVTATGLTTTAYTFTGTLDKNKAYYWQVTAKNTDGAQVSQSTISTFTTAPEKPAPPAPAPAPKTPTWVWVVIGIGAVLVIVVIVLIFRTRRV